MRQACLPTRSVESLLGAAGLGLVDQAVQTIVPVGDTKMTEAGKAKLADWLRNH